ncbi:hypothetical protein GCM10028787_31020 [Brachybacterium horti]
MFEILPLIARAEHDARLRRGERASHPYALVFPRRTSIQEHLTHSVEVRDECDRTIATSAANGPTMAHVKARELGAHFIVDSI